jgi:FMN phosphatase YigB (HAD superfamily)
MHTLTPNLVIFDLYGTLVQFGVHNHPYRKVMQWARQQGRVPQPDDARTLMTQPGDAVEVFASMGIFPPANMLAQFHADIEQELSSLTLFEDAIPTLSQLSEWQIPLAVCSNLAQPYGAALNQLLSQVPFLKFLSYEVGYIKPEVKMYQYIVERAGVNAEHCLFIGDTVLADYEGPKKFGFNAKHLIRGAAPNGDIIGSLYEILNFPD